MKVRTLIELDPRSVRGRATLLVIVSALAATWCSAQQPPSASTTVGNSGAVPLTHGDDRLLFSADASSLSGTSGGSGGAITYQHNVSPQLLVGTAVEHQALDDAFWNVGSLSAIFGGSLAGKSWSARAEIHEGAGHYSGGRAFDYGIEALALDLTVPHGIYLEVEERQIDVDTSHGSLPKLMLSKAWGPQWLTTVAYASSVGGNLDTQYVLMRLDFQSRLIDLVAGGASGRVSPVVVSIDGILQNEPRHLSDVFVGASKAIGRIDLALLLDRTELAGSDRLTGTISCLWHLSSH